MLTLSLNLTRRAIRKREPSFSIDCLSLWSRFIRIHAQLCSTFNSRLQFTPYSLEAWLSKFEHALLVSLSLAEWVRMRHLESVK